MALLDNHYPLLQLSIAAKTATACSTSQPLSLQPPTPDDPYQEPAGGSLTELWAFRLAKPNCRHTVIATIHHTCHCHTHQKRHMNIQSRMWILSYIRSPCAHYTYTNTSIFDTITYLLSGTPWPSLATSYLKHQWNHRTQFAGGKMPHYQQTVVDYSLLWNTLLPGLQAANILRHGQGKWLTTCTLCWGVDHSKCLIIPAATFKWVHT